jgi:hypothetical protein
MNRKFSIFFIVILLLTHISCEDERVVLFNGSMSSRLDIPSGLNIVETHYFIIRNVPTFFAQRAANAGINLADVSNIQSAKGLIKATFQQEDFRFVENISIYVSSTIDPSKKREMYYLEPVPFNIGEELRMLSATSELKEILSDEFVDLEIRLNFREFNTRVIPTTIDIGYTVF